MRSYHIKHITFYRFSETQERDQSRRGSGQQAAGQEQSRHSTATRISAGRPDGRFDAAAMLENAGRAGEEQTERDHEPAVAGE